METISLTIDLSPNAYEKIAARAKSRQVSISRWIENKADEEEGEEEVVPYTMEELHRRIQEAEEEYKSGQLKFYDTTEEMFKALGI